MHLRSGNEIVNYNSQYSIYKERINTVYPFNQVRAYQVEFMRNKLDSWNNRIGGENVNDLLISVMKVPELAAHSVNFRNMLKLRTGQIMNHRFYIKVIQPDVYRAFKSYFKWLKKRSDYNIIFS
jgi:hypothetical protein